MVTKNITSCMFTIIANNCDMYVLFLLHGMVCQQKAQGILMLREGRWYTWVLNLVQETGSFGGFTQLDPFYVKYC